jgi:2-isopropylmalate synthase
MLNMKNQTNEKSCFLYDTTLRDGTQRKGLSLSLEDKLRITRLLDDFGLHYIEGGWPGSNPKDFDYFTRVRALKLKNAKVSAFGSTCRVGSKPEEDNNIRCLLDAKTPCVTIVGKSSKIHVTKILQTNLEENQRIIYDSVKYLKKHVSEVIFDAEHFFDGYLDDPEFALNSVLAAQEAGADWVVLCDTNGRSLPETVFDVVTAVNAKVANVGVHTHNDSELAVANALSAVRAGARQIQGTINGYGERCGNANLVSIIPNLQLKMGMRCFSDEQLTKLTDLSRTVSEIANLQPDPYAPYVGSYAFAHKGGLHVAAVEKMTSSYEHIEPSQVGNARQVVVSELSGKGNIRMLANQLGLSLNNDSGLVLEKIKELESKGFQFENAEGTVELMIRRGDATYSPPFELIDMKTTSWHRDDNETGAEAVVKLRVGTTVFHTAAEGNGPVNAADQALRKALTPSFPHLEQVRLVDYKVRILNPDEATGAVTRVTIEASDGTDNWFTVGCSSNIIEASYQALTDSIELYLLRKATKESRAVVVA